MSTSDCICLTGGPLPGERRETFLGVNQTNGRFGDVVIEECVRCGRTWLYYHLEYEAFSRSGRWYRGLLTDRSAERVTADTAVAVLQGLKWHLCGGSYFGTTCRRRTGRIVVDP